MTNHDDSDSGSIGNADVERARALVRRISAVEAFFTGLCGVRTLGDFIEAFDEFVARQPTAQPA